jgi:hypothetical protein
VVAEGGSLDAAGCTRAPLTLAQGRSTNALIPVDQRKEPRKPRFIGWGLRAVLAACISGCSGGAEVEPRGVVEGYAAHVHRVYLVSHARALVLQRAVEERMRCTEPVLAGPPGHTAEWRT